MKENLIKEKAFAFALRATELYELLLLNREFAAKMGISSKEARESLYWIKLIEAANFADYDFKSIKEENQCLIGILTATVKTSQASFDQK